MSCRSSDRTRWPALGRSQFAEFDLRAAGVELILRPHILIGGGALSLLTGDEFSRLFHTFEHTAFRLEARDSYNAPREAESFRKFRTGEQVDMSWAESWFGMIREATAEVACFRVCSWRVCR